MALSRNIVDWLDLDVEELNRAAEALHSNQLNTFLQLALGSVRTRRKGLHRIKLLSVAQSILASPLPVLSPTEAFEYLESLNAILRSSRSESVNDQLRTVAALLLNRIPPRQLAASSSTQQIIKGLTKIAPTVAAVLGQRASSPKINAEYLRDVDIVAAAANVKEDATKDWHQDPWGWPELEWLRTDGQSLVQDRLRSSDCDEVVQLDVPKDSGGVRPASILSILDRVAYQAVVDKLSTSLLPQLPEWVFGWRLKRKSVARADYASNATEWRQFRTRLDAMFDGGRFAVRFDIREFFASIDYDLLHVQLARVCRDSRSLQRLRAFFDSWKMRSGRNGLPQRSLASSLLAQAFLSPVDQLLSKMSTDGSVQVMRWMDDIWLFSHSKSTLASAAYDVEDALLQLGLSLNSTKTRFVEGHETNAIDMSDIDEELEDAEDPATKLKQLVEGILSSAEEVSRADIGFLLAKGRHYATRSTIELLIPDLERYTYAADFCAKTLREQDLWHDRQDWYVDYADNHFGSTDWSVPAWGDMFPEESRAETVEECFSRKLSSGRQTVLLPLAADRMAHWKHQRALALFEQTANVAESAFVKRAAALAFVSVGGENATENAIAFVADDPVLLLFLRQGSASSLQPRRSQR